MKSTTSILLLAAAASASSDMDTILSTAPLFVSSLQQDPVELLHDGHNDTTWGQSAWQEPASDDDYSSMDKSLAILRSIPFIPSTLDDDTETQHSSWKEPTMMATSDDTTLVIYSARISEEEVNDDNESEDESSATKVGSDEEVERDEEEEEIVDEEETHMDEDEEYEDGEYEYAEEADGDDDVNAGVVSTSRPKTWTPSRIQSPPTSTPSSAPSMSSSSLPAPAPVNSYKSVRAPTALWPKSVARASPTSQVVVA